MRKYLISLLLFGSSTLIYGADVLFKGQPAPTNIQELHDQATSFLTKLSLLVDSVSNAQESFFNANNGPSTYSLSYTDEVKDGIRLVPSDTSQNDYAKHFKTIYIPTREDMGIRENMAAEKWTSDLYITGVDLTKLNKNIATLAADIEAAKPKPPYRFLGCPFNLPCMQPNFNKSLATIKADLKDLLPANLSTVAIAGVTFTTATDTQYGVPSKPIVCFIPPMVDGIPGKNGFSIHFPLIPDCNGNSAQYLPGLFSWGSLPYNGGIVSQQQSGDTVVVTTQDATYPGTGSVTLKKQTGGYTMQCSYSFKSKPEFENPEYNTSQTHNRTLTLEGDPTATFVARSKLLEFINGNVAVSK